MSSFSHQWWIRSIFASALAIFTVVGDAGEELSGGQTTVFASGRHAFALPLANISRESKRAHAVGNSFFNKNWVMAPASAVARDGLGPFFQATSCSACHVRDGRGALPVGLIFRFSDDALWGNQLGIRALPGVAPEAAVTIRYIEKSGTFADGASYSLRRPVYQFTPPRDDLHFSPRLAPAVFGLGLLEAVDRETIEALADPKDKDGDGISGRANYLLNIETDRLEIGRFGWKANQPNLRMQIAAAFVEDIGITSSIHPEEALTEKQRAEIKWQSGGSPEIDDHIFQRVVSYQRTLAPPARRNWDDLVVLRGKKLFQQAKCSICHVPELKTGAAALPELANQTIRPFTDLLLHDMGADLADNRPDGEASGSEWRTPPLWGIGLVDEVNGNTFFLHDGRARSFAEAILWHGGEAKESREAFRAFNVEDRRALIRFLQSL